VVGDVYTLGVSKTYSPYEQPRELKNYGSLSLFLKFSQLDLFGIWNDSKYEVWPFISADPAGDQ